MTTTPLTSVEYHAAMEAFVRKVPDWARPFCWHCRRDKVWRGLWLCPIRAASLDQE